jgi:glycosyltransferase involved in cell wall biosynthesis
LEKGLARLVQSCEAGLCIGESMCEAYSGRYGRGFLSFQNCIELNRWAGCAKSSWHYNEPFTIGYTGRIGTANSESLLALAAAISRFAERGLPLRLKLVISNKDSADVAKLQGRQAVEVLPRIPHDEMPAFLSSCDALLLPLDFDPRARDFARYSMPSKLPEYLASGSPVLVVAPPDMALTQYVVSRSCALAVTSLSTGDIEEALMRLLHDETLRQRLGTNGIAVAANEHDAQVVRARFRRVLSDASRGIVL